MDCSTLKVWTRRSWSSLVTGNCRWISTAGAVVMYRTDRTFVSLVSVWTDSSCAGGSLLCRSGQQGDMTLHLH